MKMRAVLLLLVLFLGVSAAAQSGRARPTDPNAPREVTTPTPEIPSTIKADESDTDEVVKISTDIVSFPVSVFDRKGRYIFDLKQDEFQLFEDGKAQEIAFFGSTEQPFTEKLKQSIKSTRFKQGTSLYDAMDFVISQRLAKVDGRKAIVLFSDGVDTTSRKGTLERNLADAEELDSLIYTINYDTYADMKLMDREGMESATPRVPQNQPPLPAPVVISTDRERRSSANTSAKPKEEVKLPGLTGNDYKRAKFYLETLAELTGGRTERAETLYDLDGAFGKIAQELRQQYSIGYYPPDSDNTVKSRRIRVKVTRPKLLVKARDSYTLGEKKIDQTAPGKRPVLKKRK